MGLPFWEMPDHLVIDGVSYPIDTDFRVGIRIRQMFWEPYYQKRQEVLVDGIRHLLFFGAEAARGQEAALLCAVLWYLMDGRISEKRLLRQLTDEGAAAAEAAALSGGDTVFSYLWDMPSVYAAFLSEYHTDLLTVGMHLWQFDALFAALPEECALRRTMALRAMPIDSAEDGEARAALAAQKLSVRVPDADMLHQLCLSQKESTFDCSFAKHNKTEKGLSDAEQDERLRLSGINEVSDAASICDDPTSPVNK